MSTHSFRFSVGAFDCIAIADGAQAYPVGGFFVNAPRAQLEQVLREHHIRSKRLEIPYTCLAINAHARWVLVDTGRGANTIRSAGKLLQNLAAEGIAPADIDTVILTHGHGDHIGGSADKGGKPTFPQARYVMSRKEWDFWHTKVEVGKQNLKFVRGRLSAIQSQLDLIEKETEILPGIRAIPAPGHTPGHMVLTISSGQEKLWYTADAIIHPLHLEHPDWYSAFDLKSKQARATMRRILERVTAQNSLVFACHFPFPGLGRVVQERDAWQWRPLETGQAARA